MGGQHFAGVFSPFEIQRQAAEADAAAAAAAAVPSADREKKEGEREGALFLSGFSVCRCIVASPLIRLLFFVLCVLAGFLLGAFYGSSTTPQPFVHLRELPDDWATDIRRLSTEDGDEPSDGGYEDQQGEGTAENSATGGGEYDPRMGEVREDREASDEGGEGPLDEEGPPGEQEGPLEEQDGPTDGQEREGPPQGPPKSPLSNAGAGDPGESGAPPTDSRTAAPSQPTEDKGGEGNKVSTPRKQRRKKRKTGLSNGPDPHTFRSELCYMLKMDPVLQEWYALLVLFVAEWPTYARHGNGGDAFIDHLRTLGRNFEVPKHATTPVQTLFAEELACGTPSFFLNGLDAVAQDIHKHHDLIMLMRKYRKNQDFADLIYYTQVTKLPADVSISGFPTLLRTVFEGFSFCFSRNLYVKSGRTSSSESKPSKRPGWSGESRIGRYVYFFYSFSSSGALTMADFYDTYVEQYQQIQFQCWLLLMMASVMKRIVSSRPHAGIMVLKFDSAQALGLGRGRGNMDDLDKAAIDSLQRQVAASIEGKLDRSLLRFQTFQSVQSPLIGSTSAMRPNVSVTGYLERTQANNFVDHGIFGMDIELDTLEELKEKMAPGNLLVDVSVVDPWSSRPLNEWPDPSQRDVLALTAYTATQLLCAELQWDPSLGNLGHVEVVYSGFTDVYDSVGGAQQSRAKFDSDVQVLLLRDNQKFVDDGLEEGSKKKISNLLAKEPLQWGKSRVIDTERIQWRGIARLLRGGQMYRKNAFGMGLPPALRRCAEELLKPNVVLIHIAIRGLGELTPDTLGFEMTASEMASRLVRRSRGIYDAVLVKSEPTVVKDMQIKGEQRCVGDMPKWVVLVASLSVALFFLILITLLLYHEKIKLPWWIMCICSSRAPWEEASSSVGSAAFPAEVLEKQSNSTRDIIAFAPPLKEMTTSM
ncbi:hypothetical protein Efla_007598 [Eimeria flavescens]